MKRLVALGISIGVLAGIATWISGSLHAVGSLATPLVVWVAFAAWACFYAAGGGTAGLTKTLGGNVSGVFWGWLIFEGATHTSAGSAAVLGVFVALGAFAMCVQAAWPPVAFIPGAFVGAAAYFGTGTLWKQTLISLVVGALFAYASERLGDVVENALSRRPSAVPTPA